MRSVAETLAAKLVLVAEAADPSGVPVRVVAGVYAGAPIEEPFEYDTVSQPCALVPGQTLASFPEGLVEQFPEDQGARDMGLDLAVCLRDSRTNYHDHLAVLDERRIEAKPEDVAVLKSFTARAGAELERGNREAALQASRARVIEAADAERRRIGRDLHHAPSSGCSPSPPCCGSPGASPRPSRSVLETAEQEPDRRPRRTARPASAGAVRARAAGGDRVTLDRLVMCVDLDICPTTSRTRSQPPRASSWRSA